MLLPYDTAWQISKEPTENQIIGFVALGARIVSANKTPRKVQQQQQQSAVTTISSNNNNNRQQAGQQ